MNSLSKKLKYGAETQPGIRNYVNDSKKKKQLSMMHTLHAPCLFTLNDLDYLLLTTKNSILKDEVNHMFACRMTSRSCVSDLTNMSLYKTCS